MSLGLGFVGFYQFLESAEGIRYQRIEPCFFFSTEILQHEVCNRLIGGRATDSDANPVKPRANSGDDVAQAIVPGVTAVKFQTDVAEGNIELVVQHDQAIGAEPIKVQ